MKYPWLRIENKNKVGEIHIYGEIADEKWFEEDVTPVEVKRMVHSLKGAESINMYVNSPGGGVFAGMTIFNMLSRLPQRIIAYVDGLAASIASVITLAADIIYIPETAMMMVHNPSGVAMGDSEEMRKTADLLDNVKNMIMTVYNEKTRLSIKKIGKMMDNETWMSGQEAVDLGFADGLGGDTVDVSAQNNCMIFNGLSVDVTKYRRFPKEKIDNRIKSKEQIKELRHKFNLLKNQ